MARHWHGPGSPSWAKSRRGPTSPIRALSQALWSSHSSLRQGSQCHPHPCYNRAAFPRAQKALPAPTEDGPMAAAFLQAPAPGVLGISALPLGGPARVSGLSSPSGFPSPAPSAFGTRRGLTQGFRTVADSAGGKGSDELGRTVAAEGDEKKPRSPCSWPPCPTSSKPTPGTQPSAGGLSPAAAGAALWLGSLGLHCCEIIRAPVWKGVELWGQEAWTSHSFPKARRGKHPAWGLPAVTYRGAMSCWLPALVPITSPVGRELQLKPPGLAG